MTADNKLNSTAKGASGFFRSRGLHRGLAAVLLLSTSTVALRADDRDLQKELDSLKAQINSLKAAIGEQRAETKKNKEKIKVVADRAAAYPVGPAPGYTSGGFQPIGGFDDKKFHFGGITITPGGYLAAEGVFRSRATGGDDSSGFTGIPFRNAPLANTNEIRGTIRSTRLAALIEGNISSSILGSGYVETDFFGTGTSYNQNQTNSAVLRVRHAYVGLDFLDSGFHVLAGQTWSLLTTNSKGITPRNEVGPPIIDQSVVPGYLYARTAQIRLVKDFDKKLWLALSVENPATSSIVGCNNIVTNQAGTLGAGPGNGTAGANPNQNITCLTPGTSGGFGQQGQVQQISLNHIPDVIGKVAYEARVADRDVHLEAFGVYRNFYDRVNYGLFNINPAVNTGYSGGSQNQNSNAGFVGGAILAPIIPKVLDLEISGATGYGLGRYTSAGLNDATLNAAGAVVPLRGTSAIAGLTYHVTPLIDVYAFGGFDKTYAQYGANGAGGYVGFGSPVTNNSGCTTEGAPATACAGNTGTVYQITGGIWDKIYQGSYGYFRAGVQYSYTKRVLLPGLGGISASTDDHIIFTSLRYYPF